MSNSDVAFHMALQNVLVLQLISIGVCALSSTLPDANRDVCAWVVPTLISLFSIYLCTAMLQTARYTTSDVHVPRDTRWNGVVYVLMIALALNVVYSGYHMVKNRTLAHLWSGR
jgi:TRAP-type C4-dicarboxylate transport system permease small subunit